MKVLFLGSSHNLNPWYSDVVDAAAGRWAIELFDRGKELDPQFQSAEVVVDQGGSQGTRSMIDLAAAGGVKLWQVLGTGLDHTDVAYILEKGIPLANTPGPFSAVALAEHAIFLMLLFAKQYASSQASIQNRILCEPMNEELAGKTLGLIGFGASGRELARRAKVLGLRIVAIDVAPISQAQREEYGIATFGGLEALDTVLSQSDYLSLHAPLTSKTRHMINQAALAKMKEDAVLINVARGEIVDEDALHQALKAGRLRGAGIDVFSKEPVDPHHPLLQLSNVVATPHVAGVTFGTSRRRAAAVVENLERIANRLPPLYQVTKVE